MKPIRATSPDVGCAVQLVKTRILIRGKCLSIGTRLRQVRRRLAGGGDGRRKDWMRDALSMRQNGTVKFFNQAKGYGFISPADGGKDVFVHITAVQRSGIPELSENMKISFEVQPDKKGRGPQAVNLQID
jgi:cold shock protein